MSISELKLIKRCAEFLPQSQINSIPHYTRGIYALLRQKKEKDKEYYDVVYVGMAGGPKAGIRGRLGRHLKKKKEHWTHFSLFEVWDNITQDEVRELEGLFRHIYRKDRLANLLNTQRGFKKLKRVQVNNLGKWKMDL